MDIFVNNKGRVKNKHAYTLYVARDGPRFWLHCIFDWWAIKTTGPMFLLRAPSFDDFIKIFFFEKKSKFYIDFLC